MRAPATFAAILLLLAPATSQSVEVLLPGTQRHGDVVAGPHGLTLPAGEFTIAEMLDAAAGYLCRNFVYDASEVIGCEPFRLQRSLSLDALGTEEVLHALLSARNLAMLPLDPTRGLYYVVPLDSEPRSEPMAQIMWRRPADLLARPHLRELTMTAVHVDHLDARLLANALRNHFAMQRTWRPGSPTVTCAGPQSLLLHGYGDQLAQIITALRELDRQAAPRPASDDPTLQQLLEANRQLLRRVETLEQELQSLRRQLGR